MRDHIQKENAGIRPSTHSSLSLQSNRRDPQFTAYYQQMADICCVFWEFHKECLASGAFSFTHNWTERGETSELDLDALVHEWNRPIPVTQLFSEATRRSLTGSARLFLDAAGDSVSTGSYYSNVEPPPSAKALIGDHVVSLVAEAAQLGRNISKVHGRSRKLSSLHQQ